MDIINSVPILGPCLADLSQCAEAFKIGLFNGLIIALIAIGYTLVYGILQLINFANGDVFMVGTMLTWIGVSFLGLHEGSPTSLVVVTLVVLLVAIMLITAGLNAVDRAAGLSATAERTHPGHADRGHRHVVHPPERRPGDHRPVAAIGPPAPVEQGPVRDRRR